MRSLRVCGFAVMILALMAMTPDVPTTDGVVVWDALAEMGPAPYGLEAPAPWGLTFEMSLEHVATTEMVQPFTAESPEALVALLDERPGDRLAPMPGRYRPG